MLIELLHIHTLERKLLRLGPLSKALPKRRLRLRQAVGIRHPNKGPVITEAINDSQLVASLLPSALGTRCHGVRSSVAINVNQRPSNAVSGTGHGHGSQLTRASGVSNRCSAGCFRVS